MAAPRWIFVAFLLTLSLELCYSHRPLTTDGAMNNETNKDEAHDTDTMSKNVIIKDDAVIGGPECSDNNCGGCNHPGCVIPPPVIVPTPCEPPFNFEPLPPFDNEPCLPPIPPIIVVPPIDDEPCLPPLPPIIIEPPIANEPCLPPLPPIIVEPPFSCPECPRCDFCVNYSNMDAAMAPAPAS